MVAPATTFGRVLDFDRWISASSSSDFCVCITIVHPGGITPCCGTRSVDLKENPPKTGMTSNFCPLGRKAFEDDIVSAA